MLLVPSPLTFEEYVTWSVRWRQEWSMNRIQRKITPEKKWGHLEATLTEEQIHESPLESLSLSFLWQLSSPSTKIRPPHSLQSHFKPWTTRFSHSSQICNRTDSPRKISLTSPSIQDSRSKTVSIIASYSTILIDRIMKTIKNRWYLHQ